MVSQNNLITGTAHTVCCNKYCLCMQQKKTACKAITYISMIFICSFYYYCYYSL